MSKNRNILSVLALMAALGALAISMLAWVRVVQMEKKYESRLAEMESIHAQLQQEIDTAAATEPTEAAPAVPAALKNWDLKTTPWYDNGGADVTLTAVPAAYEIGMDASFLVTLDGAVAADIPCSWDGKAFTATANLTARNGYSYICVLHPDDENRSEIDLASVENPVDTLAVYLADSIRSYCNLIIGDWSVADGHLNISSCYLQAQLPQLTVSGRPSRISVAKLTLQSGGEVLHTHWVTLNPGEAGNVYELDLESLSFPLPRQEAGELLELWLEVTLSDDQILTACGGSWEYADDQLQMIAG